MQASTTTGHRRHLYAVPDLTPGQSPLPSPEQLHALPVGMLSLEMIDRLIDAKTAEIQASVNRLGHAAIGNGARTDEMMTQVGLFMYELGQHAARIGA